MIFTAVLRCTHAWRHCEICILSVSRSVIVLELIYYIILEYIEETGKEATRLRSCFSRAVFDGGSGGFVPPQEVADPQKVFGGRL